ncbi:MAG TPA: terminase gpA endonuclease subunit [Gemmatimonadaceae bacterium]|nr:terminase gpA endonuclease subunit [Gemmatimonadaceae bacterium]
MTAPRLVTHPDAWRAWRDRRHTAFVSVIAPRARPRPSDWVEQNIWLPPDNTSQAGPYRYENAPYLRELVDWLGDSTSDEAVVCKSAQVGFTVGVLVAGICYSIDQDPAPILVMQPTLDDAERFSKKKLMPIVRASARMRKLIAEARPGDAQNTILQKSGPGWSVSIVGAKSPRQMRSDSIRFFYSDERSAYDRSAGAEGNPYLLGKKRTDSFDNRKILTGSTPLVDPDEIEREYQDSDRRRWMVPCPHCGHEQWLKFSQLRWDKEGEGKHRCHLTKTAYYVCEANGCVIEERFKRRMVQSGHFVAENPDNPKPGWFINQLNSLFPQASWANIAKDFIKAQGDDTKLQIFFNTTLAESWQERGEKADASVLERRREVFAAPVPMRVGLLTGSADIQKDRIEMLVKGWGAGEESWQIAHYRIMGDTKDRTVWDTLDRLRRMPWRHESGIDLYIQKFAVDSGDQTDLVYDYVKGRQREGVIAVKGEERIGKPMVIRPGKAKEKGVKLWLVGTHTAKSRLFSRLRIEPPGPADPPRPGAIHIPMPQPDGMDEDYLAQFGNNKGIPKKKADGRTVIAFKKTGPDEAIDMDVYALAALHACGDKVRASLGQLAAQLQLRADALPPRPASEPAPQAPPAITELPKMPAAAALPRQRGRRVRSNGVV